MSESLRRELDYAIFLIQEKEDEINYLHDQVDRLRLQLKFRRGKTYHKGYMSPTKEEE